MASLCGLLRECPELLHECGQLCSGILPVAETLGWFEKYLRRAACGRSKSATVHKTRDPKAFTATAGLSAPTRRV